MKTWSFKTASTLNSPDAVTQNKDKVGHMHGMVCAYIYPYNPTIYDIQYKHPTTTHKPSKAITFKDDVTRRYYIHVVINLPHMLLEH